MSEWGAINAYEVPGSRTETYNRLEMTAKVSLLCPWNTRDVVLGQISATPYPLPPDAATRYYPAYPRSFDISVFEEKGKDSDVNAVTYTKAKIDVSYTCKSRNWESTITQTFTPILNMQRLPPFGFHWASDDIPITDEEAPSKFNPMLKITRNITGAAAIPQWFWGLAGCVNANAWTDTITGHTHPAETLLFTPATATKQLTTNPDDVFPVWDIAYELLVNPLGWNRFLRMNSLTIENGTRLDRLKFKGDNYNMYFPKPFPLDTELG